MAKKTINRRKFLQITGAATGAAATLGFASVTPVAAAVPAGNATNGSQPTAVPHGHAADSPKPLYRGRMFFTNDTEFSTLAEAAERIFPADELGPGAKDLAVPYFIDNQLAGAWGYNAREYMGGPHFVGAATQGYQTPLLRRDLFKQGLAALNGAAQSRHSQNFARISPAEQDAILADCAAGKLTIPGTTSGFFFALLKEAVLAGAYSDPMYNGNDNMAGWRMKQYPGAQMAYTYLMSNEQFQVVEPLSLSSMQ